MKARAVNFSMTPAPSSAEAIMSMFPTVSLILRSEPASSTRRTPGIPSIFSFTSVARAWAFTSLILFFPPSKTSTERVICSTFFFPMPSTSRISGRAMVSFRLSMSVTPKCFTRVRRNFGPTPLMSRSSASSSGTCFFISS